MTEPSGYRDHGAAQERDSATGPPRWAKVLGIVLMIVVLLVVAMMLVDGGGGHTPPSHA